MSALVQCVEARGNGRGFGFRLSQAAAEDISQKRRVIFVTGFVGGAIGVLVDGIAGFCPQRNKRARDRAVIRAAHHHIGSAGRGWGTCEDSARHRKKLDRGIQRLEREQPASKLNAFIARVVQISCANDIEASSHLDDFVLVLMVDHEPAIAVCDHQIASFKLMLVKFFEGAVHAGLRVASPKDLFAEQSSGAVATQRFECSSVADPDKYTVLIYAQPGSTTSLVSRAKDSRLASLDARACTPSVKKLLSIGCYKYGAFRNHAILNG